MSFAHFSLPLILGGLVGLAGLLFLLQRLRVRHQERRVVTTIFWQQAAQEARARVFRRRFRHPLAYLFILLITALIWLAAAGPRSEASGERSIVLLLDGSAAMGRGERLETAKQLLLEAAEALPREQTSVLLGGARVDSLLLPGEHRLLLEQRLAAVQAEGAPSSVGECLSLIADSAGESATTVLLFGGLPAAEQLELLPETLELISIDLGPAPEAPPAITAMGVSPAASGDWQAVDLYLRLRGAGARDLELAISGAPGPAPTEVRSSGAEVELHYRDLPARGQQTVASLRSAGPEALEGRAMLTLPERSAIRVALDPELELLLGPVLRGDPAVALTDQRADVYVGRAGGETHGAELLFEFVSPGSQAEAFLFQHPAGLDSDAFLQEAVSDFGLDRIDATGLAEEMGEEIGVGARPGSTRSIALWDSLLSERYDFTSSMAFPLFVARGLRWLTETEDFPREVRAGQPVPDLSGRWVDQAGRAHDPVGLEFQPPRAGVYKHEDGSRLAVSLVTALEASAGETLLLEQSLAGLADGQLDWLRLFALLAFLLLLIEWFLQRRGRMP